MNWVEYWNVCWNQANLIELPCQDKYCSTCISMWMTEWVISNKLTADDQVKCINHQCTSTLSYNIVITQLNGEEAERLNQAYNQVYFSHTNDIVACPWSGCNYIGFVTDKACSSQLNWEKWGFSWRLSSQMSTLDKIKLTLRNMFLLHFETFSYLNDVIFGKPCPNWSIIIYKDGGCDKVTWTNCNHKFWWYCQGLHNNTSVSQSEDCIMPRLLSPLIILIALLLIVLKLSIQAPNLISEIQLYSDKAVEIISLIIQSFLYFSALSIEVIFIYLSSHTNSHKIAFKEAIRSKQQYVILSIIYPIAWSYGFYTNFIHV